MQTKPGSPIANCSIKLPDSMPVVEGMVEDEEPVQRRQQLINFGHTEWGFNNWNWKVTKQELDFVELSNGKYTAGVVSFVSVTVKSFDIHRENVGYATSIGPNKGAAIHRARKCAVTNALRETLLSFGGTVASNLMDQLESHKPNEIVNQQIPPEPLQENNPNLANKLSEPKNIKQCVKKEINHPPIQVPIASSVPVSLPAVPAVKNLVSPPVAKAHLMPANLPSVNRGPPANAPRPPVPVALPPPIRPNSNVSFVLQPVMGGVVPPMYNVTQPRFAPPPPPPPHVYQNCYEYPWHFAFEPYDRHHSNVNVNFNIPPKNLVVNGRGSVECKREEPHFQTPQGCWIKPTIFYDGFWTEQKVKKWVAEQVEKQFPDEASKANSPGHVQEPSTAKS